MCKQLCDTINDDILKPYEYNLGKHNRIMMVMVMIIMRYTWGNITRSFNFRLCLQTASIYGSKEVQRYLCYYCLDENDIYHYMGVAVIDYTDLFQKPTCVTMITDYLGHFMRNDPDSFVDMIFDICLSCHHDYTCFYGHFNVLLSFEPLITSNNMNDTIWSYLTIVWLDKIGNSKETAKLIVNLADEFDDMFRDLSVLDDWKQHCC